MGSGGEVVLIHQLMFGGVFPNGISQLNLIRNDPTAQRLMTIPMAIPCLL